MSPSDSTVLFQCGSARLARTELRKFAERLRIEVAKGRPFDCLIARDADLQKLNRDFLQHDHATDVLSFPSGAPQGFAGEVAISLDRARAQAAEQGHSLEDEIRILMLHGLLHLLGMDHERDRGAMRRAETKWRKALALPTALLERAHA